MSAEYHPYPHTYTTPAGPVGLPYPGSMPGMAMGQGASFAAPNLYPGVASPYAGYPYHYGQQAYAHYAAPSSSSFFGFGNERFVKGLLIGAAATYLLTNESVQQAAIKGMVKVWSMVQGGVEELKERFQDAEAELRAGAASESAEGP